MKEQLEVSLSFVFTSVPTPVLMSKFSDTTKALMDVMSKQAMFETASALRWVSGLFFCLSFYFTVNLQHG